MLLYFVVFLSFVQFSVHAFSDQCTYALRYCLDSDGSTACTGRKKVMTSLTPLHHDEGETLSINMAAFNARGPDPVHLSFDFNVKGKPYSFYCSSNDSKHSLPESPFDRFTFSCNWKLSLTGNKQIAPVTNDSINIDLATIDDNVPISLGFNNVKSIVAPNLKGSLIHQLAFLECPEENRMTFYDNEKQNRIMMKKNMYTKEMETFVYGLIPDQKSTDRSVKFVNADGVSLTISCNNSFGTLTGFVQQGDKKESIDNLFTFKSLDGYRCGSKLPLLVQTNSIKFNFNSKPVDFSFSSTSGSSVSKSNILFHTENRKWG